MSAHSTPTPAGVTSPAADCHAHIFDPAYPFAPVRRYTPEPSRRGGGGHFAAVLDAHGFTHGLLVAAAPYGGDNGHVLDAIALAPGRFKGIAILTPGGGSDRPLPALAAAGVVGLRVDLAHGPAPIAAAGFAAIAAQMRDLGWLLQVHSIGDGLAEAEPLLRALGLPLLFDHFGRPDPARGLEQPGFQALLRFGGEGRHAVKLSGPFRAGRSPFPHVDTDRFVAAAVESFGLDNCVWGSDWPFVNMDERVDYGPPMTCLERWLPDAEDRRRVLWNNAVRLFGFGRTA